MDSHPQNRSQVPPVQYVITQPAPRDYQTLANVSWGLLVGACVIAFIPFLGFGAWLIAGPVFLTTFILGIIILNRGGTLHGVLILVFTIFFAPVIVGVAPLATSIVASSIVVAKPHAEAPDFSPESMPETVAPTSAETEEVKLVAGTLTAFQNGIRAGTFRDLYEEQFSELWKRQMTAEQFDRAFERFLSAKVELDPAAFRAAPVFSKETPPDAHGIRHFAGSYLVQNANGGEEVKWEFDYLHEDRGWGLTMIRINTVPISTVR